MDKLTETAAVAVLRAYEKWEGDLILDNRAWTRREGLPCLTQELWDRLLEIQNMRNSALKSIDEWECHQ